jgi:hypothetical protein
MPDSASLYEEEEDDEYSDNNSERTDDTLDRLLENYTFSFKPEVRLKWHKRYITAMHGGRCAALANVVRPAESASLG